MGISPDQPLTSYNSGQNKQTRKGEVWIAIQENQEAIKKIYPILDLLKTKLQPVLSVHNQNEILDKAPEEFVTELGKELRKIKSDIDGIRRCLGEMIEKIEI